MKLQKYSPDKIDGKYDVIIIGSGISGLCSAALLGMEGKKVLVIEKHFKIGGYTHTFKRQNYEWDVGIHYIGGVHREKAFSRKLFDKITEKGSLYLVYAQRAFKGNWDFEEFTIDKKLNPKN